VLDDDKAGPALAAFWFQHDLSRRIDEICFRGGGVGAQFQSRGNESISDSRCDLRTHESSAQRRESDSDSIALAADIPSAVYARWTG
jgi:hypothetical protein